jgi:type IV secretory pathway VirB2 component (pilin)
MDHVTSTNRECLGRVKPRPALQQTGSKCVRDVLGGSLTTKVACAGTGFAVEHAPSYQPTNNLRQLVTGETATGISVVCEASIAD